MNIILAYGIIWYNSDKKVTEKGEGLMFIIGIIFADIFFVNSVVIHHKIHQRDNEKTFSENLQLQILIGVISLSLALFFLITGM